MIFVDRHMFMFDCEQPQVLYTAEESGFIHRIDMRSSDKELVFVNSAAASNSDSIFRRLASPGAVKVLAQSPQLGSSQLFVAGRGFDIGLLDLRLARSGSGSAAVGSRDVDESTAQFRCTDF